MFTIVIKITPVAVATIIVVKAIITIDTHLRIFINNLYLKFIIII